MEEVPEMENEELLAYIRFFIGRQKVEEFHRRIATACLAEIERRWKKK